MQYSDLRLDGFIAALSIPAETIPSVSIGFTLLTISIFFSTWQSAAGALIQLALAPIAIYYFLDFGYGPYKTPRVGVDVGLATVALYGIMRVLETTFVSFLDDEPPYWIVEGKKVPLPQTTTGRYAYAVDLTTSLRGNSWFANTHWDWAPKALVETHLRFMSRSRFVVLETLSLVPQYLALDVLDAIAKSRTWDTSNTFPITSLSWPEQILFSTTVCAQTVLAISISFTLASVPFVMMGSRPENWPSMFHSPFSATSLTDFWTKRWHAIFRRVFLRLSSVVIRILPIRPGQDLRPSTTERIIRSILVFALSALLHILLIYRIDMRQPGGGRNTFFDPSILKFFLSQPLGIVIETLIVLPACNALVPSRWRSTVTRIWAWGFLLWAGRYWSDVWINRGFWEPKERAVGWSLVRGLLYNRWKA